MAELTNGTTLNDTITISKQTGTKITLNTNKNYVPKNIELTLNVSGGTITNNTTLPSGKTSSGTINSGSYIKIGEGYYNEQYYLAQNNNSGTLTIDTSKDNGTISVNGYANVNITGINISKPSSGTNTFQIKVPNGINSTVIFTFIVDSNGNTTIN